MEKKIAESCAMINTSSASSEQYQWELLHFVNDGAGTYEQQHERYHNLGEYFDV